ncbi:hypothetical protein Dda_6854 [Drechslerella dactyloides]|uniref:Calponin-homology (CH) domain-containing protein n=1 Tax=Drechslerella dactyloides TaxID=74499 RepID=A0AAD6IUB3_DREDA|nr:hypothetical protein Dda_6854 [Drechslerella dactyloides]
MDLIDTPCPPPNRRKRLRPPSPEPSLLADETNHFTTELPATGNRRRLPSSLAVAPKRRKIPLSLLPQRKSVEKKQPERTTTSTNVETRPKTAESVFSAASNKIRRMSTRSQTAVAASQHVQPNDAHASKTSIPPSSPAAPVNSSVLHADVSDIDSTSTTIMPHSSPNVSANISTTSISALSKPSQNHPPKKRRRISELVRRVASAAAAKATSTKPKPPIKPKQAPSKPAKSTAPKPVDKKPTTTATKAASRAIPAKKSRNSSATTTTTASSTSTLSRPALRQVTRGMNPAVRSAQTDTEQPAKKPSASTLGRLRLQKASTKAFSDTEYTKRTRVTKPSKQTRKSASEYAKLEYSLKPELYDTTWLDSQEGVLEQLANDILSATIPKSPPECEIRESLIDLYNSDEYCMLLERLKASILHGVLKPTDDQLDHHPKLGDDLGLRDRFAKLFTQAYNQQSVKLAMEVVTGRSLGSGHIAEPDIQRFFETFFVDIEDDNGTWESYSANAHGSMRLWTEAETAGSKAWVLRRIIQRTLLLVKLLDHGKTSGIFHQPLFLSSSEFKSSEALLTKLLMLLLPTLGNAIRGLKNCRYAVSHVQKPEEEFNYTISNIKIDLRSGTRLAKLAELLSPPSQSSPHKVLAAVALLPRTKAEKVANVSAVLNHLYATGCLPADSVKPSDIVDGHREVTLSCLWALVAGKVGLSRLVNWAELEREIRRLWRKYRLAEEKLAPLSQTPISDTFDETAYLHRLDLWVHAMTAPRNISCANAATTFTNGDIVTAILDEYQPLSTLPSSQKPQSLSDKLKTLGCSTAFLNLFTPKTDRIVNDNFVIAALAFLASRVLAATARTRAATAIQRFYRNARFRRQIFTHLRNFIQAAEVEAAAAVQLRREKAAIVIQRAWRDAVSRRVVALTVQLTAVQALARGHLVRRRMDYRFRADGGREERVKSVIEALKKAKEAAAESDPYALGKAGGGKGRKGRRKKERVVEDVDIWQDLADVEE